MGETDKRSFTAPRLTAATLDTYIVRRAVVTALRDALPLFHGVLLDVGCGMMPYRELILEESGNVTRYVGMDIPHPSYPADRDLEWDGKTIPLDDCSVDSAMATEVFEHCPDISVVLSEIFRVLKPGGMLFLTVPFVWPLHNVPNDEYRFTPFALRRHLEQRGFIQCELKALGGWDATLAQVLGLWVRRRPFSSLKRALLSALILPVTRFLLTKDDPTVRFGDGVLVTGLSGMAWKPLPEGETATTEDA